MVKYSSEDLDRVFKALSDPTRRAILCRLADGDAAVTELAAPFDMSLPAFTKHLDVLLRAGLLETEKSGRVRRCHIEHRPLQQAADWIAGYRVFWDTRLDRLDDYFKNTSTDKEQT